MKIAKKVKAKLLKKFKQALKDMLYKDQAKGVAKKKSRSAAMRKLDKWMKASELADAYKDTGSFFHVTCNYIKNVRGYPRIGNKKGGGQNKQNGNGKNNKSNIKNKYKNKARSYFKRKFF